MVVHLHAGASHPSVQTPANSTRNNSSAGQNAAHSPVGTEVVEGFEHIDLSAVPKPAGNDHADSDAATDDAETGGAKFLASVTVDGVSSGLVSAVSWLLAIEACKKNAAPLPTAITLLIEGAHEFRLCSPTLRRLVTNAFRSLAARVKGFGSIGGGGAVWKGARGALRLESRRSPMVQWRTGSTCS